MPKAQSTFLIDSIIMASRFVPRVLNQVGVGVCADDCRPAAMLRKVQRSDRRSKSILCPVGFFKMTDAGRYASAVYVAALQKGEKTLDKVMNDLKGFHDILGSSSQDSVKLRTFLTNPTISASNKDQVFAALTTKGGADEITRYVEGNQSTYAATYSTPSRTTIV